MMGDGRVPRTLTLLTLAAAIPLAGRLSAAQAAPDLEAVLARVGDRLSTYYQRAQRIVCTETSTVQPIGRDWSVDGLARTVESELRIEGESVVRDVRRINGRAPRERDRTDRSGCTDPVGLAPEPLAFLTAAGRGDFRFTAVRGGRERDRAAWIVDFTSAVRNSRPELIEDPRGHDDCFDWSGPVATKGRLWIDAATSGVLRVERYTQGPVDLRVPWTLQRRYHFDPWLVIDRDELRVRYSDVAFTDPEESLLLPESLDGVTVMRGGLQSIRQTTTYTGYRRFLTAGRIKDR